MFNSISILCFTVTGNASIQNRECSGEYLDEGNCRMHLLFSYYHLLNLNIIMKLYYSNSTSQTD